MNIDMIGASCIGKTLILKLSGEGHGVKVANSRGHEIVDRTTVISRGREF